MRATWLVVAALVLVALLLIGGCGGHNAQVPPGPGPGPDGASFVGRAVCAVCHSEINTAYGTYNGPVNFANFVGSAHGQDMHSKGPNNLDVVDNPSCQPCHTIGFGEPTGFVSTAATPQLEGIGCEECHGAGSKHAGGPASTNINRVPNSATTCWDCHAASYKLERTTPALVTDATLANTAPGKVSIHHPQASFLNGDLGVNEPRITATHVFIDNTCVTCHLNHSTADKHGSDALAPDFNACQACHSNGEAKLAGFMDTPVTGVNARLIALVGESASEPGEPDPTLSGGALAAYAAAHSINLSVNDAPTDPAVIKYKRARYDADYIITGIAVHNPNLTDQLLADAEAALQ